MASSKDFFLIFYSRVKITNQTVKDETLIVTPTFIRMNTTTNTQRPFSNENEKENYACLEEAQYGGKEPVVMVAQRESPKGVSGGYHGNQGRLPWLHWEVFS